MKVFRVTDYEWWAGESLESIKLAYQEATGIDPDDEDEGGFNNPHELSEEAMEKLRFILDDDEGGETCSFAEHLAELINRGQKFPCCFAGTEY